MSIEKQKKSFPKLSTNPGEKQHGSFAAISGYNYQALYLAPVKDPSPSFPRGDFLPFVRMTWQYHPLHERQIMNACAKFLSYLSSCEGMKTRSRDVTQIYE